MKVRAMFSEHEIMAFMNSSQNMSENIRCPNYTNELVQLLVFSVTPFKTDQNKNQNRSIDKVQNLGNERYTKTLAKIQVRGIFRVRDIRRNVFTKLIEIFVWRRHAGAHPDEHQHGGRKPTETSVTEFCYKSVNLFFEELIIIEVILFLIHELFREQNSMK